MRLLGKKKKEEPQPEADDVDPSVFDLPIAVLLAQMSAPHDHQLDLNIFQAICDTSVHSSKDQGIGFVTDWVDTACKVGSVAIVDMLVNPQVDYLAWPGRVPSDRGIMRALSVMAAVFGWVFAKSDSHQRMFAPLTAEEFIRDCASSIDPLGASFLESLTEWTKEEEGVALAFGTFRALHVALWAPELDMVPPDQEFHELLEARDWSPRLTEAGITTPVVTRRLIGQHYVDFFIPRLTALIQTDTRKG